MLEAKTYVRTERREYVPLETFQGPLPDTDYVTGFIELTIDTIAVLTSAEWDLVDQLWAYLVDGACTVANNENFSTLFPDQPLPLVFTVDRQSDTVTIELSPGRDVGHLAKATLGRREFIAAIAAAAEPVFLKLLEVAPENRSGYELVLRQIESLKRR